MTLEGYKVVTAKEMAQMEKVSIDEGASAEQYMQTAGLGISKIAENYTLLFKLKKKVILLVGKGNNGGDAYVAGIDLMKKGFEVTAYQFFPLDASSPLCQSKGKQFLEGGWYTDGQEGEDAKKWYAKDPDFGDMSWKPNRKGKMGPGGLGTGNTSLGMGGAGQGGAMMAGTFMKKKMKKK